METAVPVTSDLQDLARERTREQGPGALFVAQGGSPPAYVELAHIQPERFQKVFAKTWAKEAGAAAFLVLVDGGNLHVVKVPLEGESPKKKD